MIAVIDRYLLREVIKIFLAVLGTVLLIVVSLLMLRALEDINAGALASDIVLRFMGLRILSDLPSLLPPIFFVAVLLALGRMAQHSELIAFAACGIGPIRTYRALFFAAIPVALLAAWLTLHLRPQVVSELMQIRTLQQDEAQQLFGIKAGRFYQHDQGRITLYVDEIQDGSRLRNIFIHDQREDVIKVILSQEGLLREEEATGQQFVTLLAGQRYDGQPGTANYAIGEFDRYSLRLQPRQLDEVQSEKRATYPTQALLISGDRKDMAEFQFRLSSPLAVITLTLLAVPLTARSPRQRNTWRMFIAFLTYISFFNLQRVATNWYESGATPPWLGSLWYQLAVLGLVLAVVLPTGRWLRRIRPAASSSA
ncbi:MAG: LPS export ABC transporter permease LptF [Gammaproteobacteria bacterium]|jgi:lipopolysaccharide export system permease protein|nr:LPS export ABC transporter permease LptF [Gammaproteobacteria bacterium]